MVNHMVSHLQILQFQKKSVAFYYSGWWRIQQKPTWTFIQYLTRLSGGVIDVRFLGKW